MKRSAASVAPKTAESISTSFLLPPSNRARAALVPGLSLSLVEKCQSGRSLVILSTNESASLRRAVPHPHPTYHYCVQTFDCDARLLSIINICIRLERTWTLRIVQALLSNCSFNIRNNDENKNRLKTTPHLLCSPFKRVSVSQTLEEQALIEGKIFRVGRFVQNLHEQAYLYAI